MSFTDRVVEYPNRVVLSPVDGEENTYDMTYSEGEVSEEGTLLNAENLNSEVNSMIDTKLTGNISPSNIKAGIAILTGTKAAGAVVSKQITFDTPFATVPVVTVTTATSVPNKRSVAIASVTTTGFTIYWSSTTKKTGNDYVHWQAMAL